MERYTVQPGVAQGECILPTSKSLTHRAYILAALAATTTQKPCRVVAPLRSDDTDITFEALRTMGYEAVREQNTVIFTGVYAPPAEGRCTIYVHHSGTSARLLAAVAALQPYPVRLDGSERMRSRPMMELMQPLEQLGAHIEHTGGVLPLTITQPITHGGRVDVDASKSSQFLSALFLITPLLNGTTQIFLKGAIASQSYSDMTLQLLRDAGITVDTTPTGYQISGGQKLRQQHWEVEGDYSAASYPLAAAALTGGSVTAPNLRSESLQGDRTILEILEDFGAEVIRHESGGITVRGKGKLQGFRRDMNSCPDIVPTVAVVALFASEPVELYNIEHLRYKETDRISAVIENIQKLGGSARLAGNSLIIEPSAAVLHGAELPTYDDHRMAMSFALAGLRVPGVVIEDPACVSKSYPDFWQDWERLTTPQP